MEVLQESSPLLFPVVGELGPVVEAGGRFAAVEDAAAVGNAAVAVAGEAVVDAVEFADVGGAVGVVGEGFDLEQGLVVAAAGNFPLVVASMVVTVDLDPAAVV